MAYYFKLKQIRNIQVFRSQNGYIPFYFRLRSLVRARVKYWIIKNFSCGVWNTIWMYFLQLRLSVICFDYLLLFNWWTMNWNRSLYKLELISFWWKSLPWYFAKACLRLIYLLHLLKCITFREAHSKVITAYTYTRWFDFAGNWLGKGNLVSVKNAMVGV